MNIFFMETGSHVAPASLELTIQLKMALISESFYLCLLSAGINGVLHYAWGMCVLFVCICVFVCWFVCVLSLLLCVLQFYMECQTSFVGS